MFKGLFHACYIRVRSTRGNLPGVRCRQGWRVSAENIYPLMNTNEAILVMYTTYTRGGWSYCESQESCLVLTSYLQYILSKYLPKTTGGEK